MATIGNDSGGRRRILFVAPDGKRKTVRLGKVSRRAAEAFKIRVEHLVAAQAGVAIDAATAQWLAELSNELHNRLVAVGLAEPREKVGIITLGEFVAAYFARRSDVKPSTMIHWRHTERCLLEFFGAGRALESITHGECRDFERWLATPAARENAHGENPLDSGLAPNTIRKRICNAKQFFADAVNRELLSRNPFHGLKSNTGANRRRDYFLTRQDAEKVFDACPDAEWRLIFALSRFGGLRCPSEHLGLRWGDIHWDESRFVVHSPKTEHHEGGYSRVVPIFPELRPHLAQVDQLVGVMIILGIIFP